MLLIFLSNTYLCQIINLDKAIVSKVAEGFQFVEGPVWEDGALLFSDIPSNKVFSWIPGAGASVYLEPSGNSNGLAIDTQGNLILAQHGLRRIAILNSDGSQTNLASKYQGKRFNSPNDIAVKSDGSIFFTDPPYGITKEKEELGFYGIYCIKPDGSISLLDKSLIRPNGIAFSPDEKKLYVDDCELKLLYEWDVLDNTTIANKKLLAKLDREGYGADGMAVDKAGRIFCTGPTGVWVFAPEGNLLKIIQVPGQVTNCGWGENGFESLFVTSGDSVYIISSSEN